jgi:hypothetical protein
MAPENDEDLHGTFRNFALCIFSVLSSIIDRLL